MDRDTLGMDRDIAALPLTQDERTILAEVLESAYRDLKQEIGRTEGPQFKHELQRRRDVIGSLIEKVTGAPLVD